MTREPSPAAQRPTAQGPRPGKALTRRQPISRRACPSIGNEIALCAYILKSTH